MLVRLGKWNSGIPRIPVSGKIDPLTVNPAGPRGARLAGNQFVLLSMRPELLVRLCCAKSTRTHIRTEPLLSVSLT